MPGENPSRRGVPRPLSGGPIRFGPYTLDARLAVGGTAEVYLAHPNDPATRPQRLIVKRLLPHFVADPDGRTMFEREAVLHQSVRHENVVEVFGAGNATDGEPYLAMEYVEGADCYRLLRRIAQENRKLPINVAIYVAREVLRALESVHSARDNRGTPLGIIHRDVTPSNLYLSIDGQVKLGDFGIARSSSRTTMKNAASAMLKGKFAYLAPEQVAGEPFDHRADLFSLAVVLAEMLLGKPLFAGSGQLAVLLAIRDCKIEPLRQARRSFPPGLFEVLESALSRDPSVRFQTAAGLAAALAPFDDDPMGSRTELAALVRFVQASPSVESMAAVRESARAIRAVAPAPPQETPPDDDFSRPTGEYTQIPSFVQTADGRRQGPWPFARLVEACATGQIARGDQVDYMGRGMKPIELIEELTRFLPSRTNTTNQLPGVGAPDFVDEVSPNALLRVLLRVLERKESAVLFAESSVEGRAEGGKKELYFKEGKLQHVASNNASELLGEYLVRRKTISREELDFALAVLPRYGGRMGDTLIALGLVSGVDIFRTIRDQGRDRLTDLFSWKQGKLTLYFGHPEPQADFPLELELPLLMVAGLESVQPGDAPSQAYSTQLERPIGPATASTARPQLLAVQWPAIIGAIVDATREPKTLREMLAAVTRAQTWTPNDVLRALQIVLAARLAAWA
jgi:serine/threonine-protein kinase